MDIMGLGQNTDFFFAENMHQSNGMLTQPSKPNKPYPKKPHPKNRILPYLTSQ